MAISIGTGINIGGGINIRHPVPVTNTWSQTEFSTAPAAISDFLYGNGIYVGWTNNFATAYYTSTDLINWTSRSMPAGVTKPNRQVGTALFNAGYFWGWFSEGSPNFYARLYKSSDGINWTLVYEPGVNSYVMFTSDGDSHYCAATYYGTGTTYTSPDGTSWTRNTGNIAVGSLSTWNFALRTDGTGAAPAYGNPTSLTNCLYYTTDYGVTWTGTGPPSGGYTNWQSVQYLGGKFVALRGQGSNIFSYSSDSGVTWSAPATIDTIGNASYLNYFVSNGNTMIATGSLSSTTRSYYTTDGVNWSYTPIAAGATNFYTISYANGEWLAQGAGNKIYKGSFA